MATYNTRSLPPGRADLSDLNAPGYITCVYDMDECDQLVCLRARLARSFVCVTVLTLDGAGVSAMMRGTIDRAIIVPRCGA